MAFYIKTGKLLSNCFDEWISIFESILFLFRLINMLACFAQDKLHNPYKCCEQGSRLVYMKKKNLAIRCLLSTWGSLHFQAILSSALEFCLWLRNCAPLCSSLHPSLYLLTLKHLLHHEAGWHVCGQSSSGPQRSCHLGLAKQNSIFPIYSWSVFSPQNCCRNLKDSCSGYHLSFLKNY